MNYLYNGIELPDTPEDMPFAYVTIVYNGLIGGVPFIVNSTKKFYYNGSSLAHSQMDGRYYALENGVWNDRGYNTTMYEGTEDAYDLIWANYDILNKDGTVYLAASDPIPVGGEPIDPTSFIQGWLVGRRLAGMRKLPEVDPPESTKASVVDGVLVVTGNGTAAIVDEVLVVTGGGTAEIVDGILYVT